MAEGVILARAIVMHFGKELAADFKKGGGVPELEPRVFDLAEIAVPGIDLEGFTPNRLAQAVAKRLYETELIS